MIGRALSMLFAAAVIVGAARAGEFGESRSVTWSPDGQTLAWFSGDHLDLRQLNGSTSQQIRFPRATADLAWFPDGQSLVAVRKTTPENWDLVRVGRGGEVTPLVASPTWQAAPLVDPGGRLVLFSESTVQPVSDSAIDIWGWLPDHGPVPLIEREGDQLPLALSDDGQFLVFLSHDGERADLWVHDFQLNLDRRLTDDDAIETMARWLPHSTSVAYAAQEGPQASIWVLDVAAPAPDRLWHREGVVTDLAWGSGGTEIYFCADGELHRMTDRGRGHRVWESAPWRIRDLDLSAARGELALAGEGPPLLLSADWSQMAPLTQDRRAWVETRGRWAAKLPQHAMRGVFTAWAASTEAGAERAEILRLFGQALSRRGDHDGAIEQFAEALRAALPADPQLHRLFGEEMLFFRREYTRAEVALSNWHAELVSRGESSLMDIPPVLTILRSGNGALMQAYADCGRARDMERWRRAAEGFATVIRLSPELAAPLAGEGLGLLDEMEKSRADPEARVILCRALASCVADQADRHKVAQANLQALLEGERWDEAARQMASLITDPNALDLFLAQARGALARRASNDERPSTIDYGRDAAEGVQAVWTNAAVIQAVEEHATPGQRLLLPALLAEAAFLNDDASALAAAHDRVMRLARETPDPEQPQTGLEMAAFAESLWGWQMLRAERWMDARRSFEGSMTAIEALAEEFSGFFEANGGVTVEPAMALVERALLFQHHEPTDIDVAALRDEWRLQGMIQWQSFLPCTLPLPGMPDLPPPQFDGGGDSAWTVARDLHRSAVTPDSPLLWYHLRLSEARAQAALGNALEALALQRPAATQSEVPLLRRAALWQLAVLHRALGDGAAVQGDLAAWEGCDPTALERALVQAWEKSLSPASSSLNSTSDPSSLNSTPDPSSLNSVEGDSQVPLDDN
jgi:tetratricopeptide (TPR) repeat protein